MYMYMYMCFSFLPFGSGSDISVSSLQDFLLRINDQDCFGFEDVVRHAGTQSSSAGTVFTGFITTMKKLTIRNGQT